MLSTIYLNQTNEERETFIFTAFFKYHFYFTVYQTVELSCFKLHLIKVIFILFRHKYFLYYYCWCIYQVLHHKFWFIFFCDFTTVYTTIPHSKLKGRLKELVQLCFIKQNDLRRYKYLVVGKRVKRDLLIQAISLESKELLIFPDHLSSPPRFSGDRVTRCFVWCVFFCRSLFVLLYFFFVCSSSIYGFWFPLWCLQTLLAFFVRWWCLILTRLATRKVHFMVLLNRNNSLKVATSLHWGILFKSSKTILPYFYSLI